MPYLVEHTIFIRFYIFHTDLLHHFDGGRVFGMSGGVDAVDREVCESMGEHGLSKFGGETLPPNAFV